MTSERANHYTTAPRNISSKYYIGHIVSDAGLSPDPEKVNAIVASPDPEKVNAIVAMSLPDDKRALIRYLNIVKCQGKFIPGEAHSTAPLHVRC